MEKENSSSTANPTEDMEAFKRVLSLSKRIIAVAGAGLSAASGIPTFRGAGGMWRKYDAISLATPEAFKKDPSLVWQFYHYRREKALLAVPNEAHMALAAFSLPSVRHIIAPGSMFTLITQNVDGLSQRALEAVELGAADSLLKPTDTHSKSTDQPRILEMHGRLFDVICTSSTCGHVEFNLQSPVCPALSGTESLVEEGVAGPNIPLEDLPRCSKCGSLTRPGVVWFNEVPYYLDVIDKLVDEADLCLVIGTSSTVYPAAEYASRVLENDGQVAVFNLDHSEGDEEADFVFLGPCEETLPKALSLRA